MRLATVQLAGAEVAAIALPGGALPIPAINESLGTRWQTDLLGILTNGEFPQLRDWLDNQPELPTTLTDRVIPSAEIRYGPPYRRPRKIWGIGLNYVDHADDLAESAPSGEPASFMKPDTTIIGPGEEIRLPEQSKRVTAEAELGVIIGAEVRDIPESEALSVVAGFTTVIDMTAEDILRRNPRYLTRSKSFDTFFSFGPEIITLDEFVTRPEELMNVKVGTWINDLPYRENVVANMTFSPEFLVSFHSKAMTLLPGDIISTGTPGATVIADSDVVTCRIPGFADLSNPVVRPS
ncbi:MAG: fumarylacetoacetate hydrolase [Pseudonocardiaceae bacterium]|nr:fumarylacetoacetate hydrolase [Pseudonocardiaceae bacterium]